MKDAVERIVNLYTETKLTVPKFQLVVEEELKKAEERGAQNSGGGYDKGFNDGYDTGYATAMAEK